MIVTLGRKQTAYLELCLQDHPDLDAVLKVERESTAKLMIRIIAPFVAWERVVTVLSDQVYSGKPRRGSWLATEKHREILVRIAKAMNDELMHPALRGVSMVGTHYKVMRVWAKERDWSGRTWWPSPLGADGGPALLSPCWEQVSGIHITTWGPNNPVRSLDFDWTWDPKISEALIGRGDLPTLPPATPQAAVVR